MSGTHDRREFLKRLALAATYAAPAVASFRAAAAQGPGNSSFMNPNNGGHGTPMNAAAQQSAEPPGPWTAPPPGRTPPGDPTPVP